MAKKDEPQKGQNPHALDPQTRQEIERTFGFVPGFFGALPEAAHKHLWSIMRDFELGDTALSAKVKELIGLAVSAHMKCRYCVYFHATAARAHGATDEELREASAMGGFSAAMSNAITGAGYDFDQFVREVDRGVEHMKRQAAAGAPMH